MKKSIIGGLFMLVAVIALTFTSCGHGSDGHTHNDAPTKTEQAASKNGPEYTSNFICPMHCKGSGSKQAGKCPTCKMAYVANEHTGHDHSGHDHSGHDHSGHDHSGHNHAEGDHSGHNH